MYFNKIVVNCLKIIIVIFPFLLVSGSFLPDLACVLVGTLYLFYSLKNRNFEEYKNYIIYYLIIIFIYINFNSLFSFNREISFFTSLGFIRIILFIVALSFFFKTYKELKLYFFYSLCLCIFLLFIDSVFQFLLGFNLLNMKLLDQARVSSFFGHKLIMGSFVSRMMPLILGLSFLLNIKNKNIINFLILLIGLYLIFLSGERSATIYFLLTIVSYFFLNFEIRTICIYISAAILGVLIFCQFNSKPLSRIFVHTYNQVKSTNHIIGASYRHTLHYMTAYNMFLDRKLLGHGIKSFRYLCDNPKYTVQSKIINDNKFISPKEGTFYIFKNNLGHYFFVIDDVEDKNFLSEKILSNQNHNYIVQNKNFIKLVSSTDFLHLFIKEGSFVKKGDVLFSNYEFKNGCNTHPHNFFLQFLAELGLVGFALFFVIFIFSFYKLVILCFYKLKGKISNKEKFNFFIFLNIFLTFFPLLPSGNYFNNWLLLISYLPIGFYLSSKKNSDD